MGDDYITWGDQLKYIHAATANHHNEARSLQTETQKADTQTLMIVKGSVEKGYLDNDEV